MSIIYIEGRVSVTTYEQLLNTKKTDSENKNVVFLFPGNASHHTPQTTLFSIKTGGGIALAASALGQKGYPALSLPTTNMENWSTDKRQQEIVQGAIADLYRAVGAGFELMLPVRSHVNTDYFNEGLGEDETYEPGFWGGIQKSANKPLADYYIQQLNILNQFIDRPHEKRLEHSQEDTLFKKAYLAGSEMKKDDPWLQTNHQRKKTEQKSSGSEHSDPAKGTFPATYEALYNKGSTELDCARELLIDYTKGNSAIKRFFYGHWNRHYTTQVAGLVKKIDNKDISSVVDLIKELHEVNPGKGGSLFRRMRFIEQKHEKISNNESLRISSFASQ